MAEKSSYAWICNQFKSLRQDLTVRSTDKNQFTVEVYEIMHAWHWKAYVLKFGGRPVLKICHTQNDMVEYNACQATLKTSMNLEYRQSGRVHRIPYLDAPPRTQHDRYRTLSLQFITDELAFETTDGARSFLAEHSAAFFSNPNSPDDKKVLDCRPSHPQLCKRSKASTGKSDQGGNIDCPPALCFRYRLKTYRLVRRSPSLPTSFRVSVHQSLSARWFDIIPGYSFCSALLQTVSTTYEARGGRGCLCDLVRNCNVRQNQCLCFGEDRNGEMKGEIRTFCSVALTRLIVLSHGHENGEDFGARRGTSFIVFVFVYWTKDDGNLVNAHQKGRP
ncbi:Cytochrome c1, heme protein [Salix suchowensis]|nr:Cytochrome c1, heme protein [Salix suchowensis]